MAENKEAVRERVRRFRELKKKMGVTVTNVTQEAEPNDLDERLADLERRVKEIERQLSPEEQIRKQATRPGSRPNELYGA